MGMNIKDPEVHAMALSAELERLPDALSEASVEARKEAVRAISRRTSANPAWQRLSSKELQDALYDENGLPI